MLIIQATLSFDNKHSLANKHDKIRMMLKR